MRIKTLVAALVLPFVTGLVPVETASAAPAPLLPAPPTASAALAAGTGAVAMNPVVVVRNGRRRYYNRGRYRSVRRVYYRNGRRVVVIRRVRY